MKMKSKIICEYLLLFAVFCISWFAQPVDSLNPIGIFKDEKWMEARQLSELQSQRMEKIRKNTRSVAHASLFCNTGLLINGGMAFPTFISSMVAARLVHDTNQDQEHDMGTLKVYVSLIFSGIASLNGWLLRQTQPRMLERDNTAEFSLLQINLLFWSRGMELTGGFLLLFLQFLQL
jgi:hypothetical protein